MNCSKEEAKLGGTMSQKNMKINMFVFGNRHKKDLDVCLVDVNKEKQPMTLAKHSEVVDDESDSVSVQLNYPTNFCLAMCRILYHVALILTLGGLLFALMKYFNSVWIWTEAEEVAQEAAKLGETSNKLIEYEGTMSAELERERRGVAASG